MKTIPQLEKIKDPSDRFADVSLINFNFYISALPKILPASPCQVRLDRSGIGD